MKRLLLGVIAAFCSTLAYSQATEIVVETYAENIGMVGTTDLTGYNTYRVYVKFSSPDDFLTAVYGDANFPTEIHGGNNFYHSAVGALTNEGYNPVVFPAVPDLEYDSFITVGMTAPASSEDGEQPINSIGDPMNNWIPAFDPGAGMTGADIVINTQTGGSWFPLFPDANAYAGEDSLVLIGQFTTDTTLYGVVSVATFVGGDQSDDSPLVTLPFSSIPGAVFGCTDMDATNFNSEANEDDGTCIYACDYPATQLMIEASSTGDVSCSGYSDGSAVVTVTGGQGSLTYSNGTSSNGTGIFNAVPAGDVTITVTDNVGCSVETTLTVSTPDPLVVTASLSDPISCAGESDAVLSGSSNGGTGMVMYSMTAPVDTGSGPYFEMGTDVLLFEGVGVGLYTVYAIDGNGCVDNTPGIQVGQPQPFNLYAQAVAPTTCPDTEDGTVVLNFFGGSGNGTTYSTDGSTYSTENTFTLPPGTYTFYAQDVNGCPDTLTEVMVGAPAEFESLAELVSPSCFGEMDGSATVEVQGGTAPLVYVIDGDSLDNVMLTMVGAGDIAIEVVDANGCSFDASVTLSQPSEIVIDAAVTDVNCNGDENGAVTLNASGGTGLGYVYDVDNGGFGPNNEFDGLAAGSFSAVVQDDSGCSSATTVTIGSPDAIEVSVDSNDGATGAEADGSLDITVTGGTAPYTYSWEGPDFTSGDEDPSGIAAGDYTVTITDANGCEFESTTIVVVSGLSEVINLIDVTLFPNPTRGLVEVQLAGLAGESVTAVLTDGLGRDVSRYDLGNLTGVHLERMDLSGYESGVYFLRLEVADAVEVIRVVKQ